jgi:fatty acid desaturase
MLQCKPLITPKCLADTEEILLKFVSKLRELLLFIFFKWLILFVFLLSVPIWLGLFSIFTWMYAELSLFPIFTVATRFRLLRCYRFPSWICLLCFMVKSETENVIEAERYED